MTTISFTVPGEAVPWARAGARGHQRFTPAKQRNYMGALKLFASRAFEGREPLQGPVELSVLAVYGWPTSWSSRKRARPGAEWKTSAPDSDNLIKIVKDALETITWANDAQVASVHVWKRYGEIPRLSVTIRSLASCGDTTAPSPLIRPGDSRLGANAAEAAAPSATTQP